MHIETIPKQQLNISKKSYFLIMNFLPSEM